MSQGWISLHRKIQDSQFYKERRVFSKFEAWLDILMTVNHSDSEVLIGYKSYECKRGQSLLSISSWGKRWKWNESKVRRVLKLFSELKMIETESVKKTTRLTVCKYDSYQGERRTGEEQVKDKRSTSEVQVTTNNNDKKEKKEKKKNKKPVSLPKIQKKFSAEIEKSFKECLTYFDSHLHPNTDTGIFNWKDTIRKLNEIDKIPFELITQITQKARADDFWSSNFLSLAKLRTKNKDGLHYIVVFNEKFNKKINGQTNDSTEQRRKIFERFRTKYNQRNTEKS